MLGRPEKAPSEDEKRTHSGWDVKKIHDWIAQQGDCSKIEWPEVRTQVSWLWPNRRAEGAAAAGLERRFIAETRPMTTPKRPRPNPSNRDQGLAH